MRRSWSAGRARRSWPSTTGPGPWRSPSSSTASWPWPNAAAPAVPVKDTVKLVREDGVVERTLERAALRAVQTPQVFDAQLLRAALQAAAASGEEVTDDCSAVERLGKEVFLTEGSYENIKITTPEDLILAEAILQRREGAL